MNKSFLLKLFLSALLCSTCWLAAEAQIIDPTKNKLLNKSWIISNQSLNVIITSSNSTNFGLTVTDIGLNSQFIVEEADEDQDGSWFHIRHRLSGKYVTVPSQVAGTAVILEELSDNGENENQHFKLLAGGTLDRKKIRSRLSALGNTLNLQVSETTLTLIVNNPNFNANQSFSFNQSLPNNSTERYSIVGTGQGHFVSDLGYKTEQQGVVHTVDADYSTIWNFEDAGSGYYYIRNLLTRQYITAYQSNTNGAQMKMTAFPGEHAKWELVPNTSAQFLIKNKVSGYYFSTKGQNQDGDPLYQAGISSSGRAWHIIPMGEGELEILPGNITGLQEAVPFEQNPLGLQIYRPLLVSIGLPDNAAFRPAVWNALVWYYQSSEMAERALRNFNMLDNGHRAEMALVVRQYVTSYLPTIPKSDWCTGEEAMVSWLENEVKSLRLDFAQRKVDAWEEFEQLPAYGATFIDLLYQNDLDDYEAPPNYLLDDDQTIALFEFAKMARQRNLQDNALLGSGLTTSVIVGAGIVSGVLMSASFASAFTTATGAGGVTLSTFVTPGWASNLIGGPVQAALSGASPSLTTSGVAASTVAGPATIITAAALILTMQVMDVIDYVEFENKIYAGQIKAQNEVIDFYDLYNSDYILGQVNLGRDLDYIFGAFGLNATINSGTANPDGTNFLPTVNCPANVVFETPASSCEVNIPTSAEISSCYHFSSEFPYVVGSFEQIQSIGQHTVSYQSPMGITVCSQIITVEDNISPTVSCKTDNVFLSPFEATIDFFDVYQAGSATDNCGNATFESVSPNTFTCDDIGENTVTLTVNDGNGNIGTCTTTVTVKDGIPPQAFCKSHTVYLDASGNGMLAPADIDNSSTDLCGIASSSISVQQFTCADIGSNVVTLSVTDYGGNTRTCDATVTVVDNVPPTVNSCPSSFSTTTFVPATCTVAAFWGQPSFDDCQSVTVSSNFNSGDNLPAGTTAVIYTATDPSGNSVNCSFLVTITDKNDPTALCKPTFSVALDEYGNAPDIYPADINNGSSDLCTDVSLLVEPSPFLGNAPDCSNIGNPKIYTLRVIDEGGRESTCTTSISAVDNIPPFAECEDKTVVLDANGQGSLTASQVGGGSYSLSNCETISLSLDKTMFDCADIGMQNIQMTATDDGGNPATCNATITVVDAGSPTLTCQNTTVELDASGQGILNATDVEASSFDVCGIVSKTLSNSVFDCNLVGLQSVILTVKDDFGNQNQCTATVTVQDNLPAIALCKPVTVELDASGNGSLTAADLDNGSSDNCGIASRVPSLSVFDCSDVGTHALSLTVTDVNGNVSSCETTVTVSDVTPPVANCISSTVQLDASGQSSLSTSSVNQASFDNCGIASVSVSPNIFTCSNVGSNNVTLTVEDVNGLSSTCNATVTVVDITAPVAVCKSHEVYLDASGNGSMVPADIENGSADACGIGNLTVSQFNFDCNDLGINTVTLTVADGSGLTSTCTSNVTVYDVISPEAACKTTTIFLDSNGSASITPAMVDNGSDDNCSMSLSLSNTNFGCSEVGQNTVSLTASDPSGNSHTCQATVTVSDNLPPTAFCKSATIYLDENGQANLATGQIDNGSLDVCGIASFAASPNNFTCVNIGTNTVTLTVTDANSNASTCQAVVTVLDEIAPTIVCKNISIQLDDTGSTTIVPTDVFDALSSSDNCGTVNLASVSPNQFDCGETGSNTVILTTNDNSGNIATCNATVTVEDFFTSFSTSSMPEVCGMGNGSISISANGPGAQFSYSIDGGTSWQFTGNFDNLTAGSYTVIVQAIGTYGCSTDPIEVTVEQNGTPQTWYMDWDGDGYAGNISQVACVQPSNLYYLATELIATSGDCNDYDANEYPGQIWYEDMDADGYGSGFSVPACQRPVGGYLASELSATSGDCEDDDDLIHPTADEICNGLDDNCDGEVDEELSDLTYVGNVNLFNQAQVDAWDACYSVIDGNLYIKNSSIDSLTTLTNLRKVTGNVTIKSTGLDSLSWLLNLDSIGGHFTVQLNNQLETLHGLDSLVHVDGNLKVFFNNPLTECCAIHDLLLNDGVDGNITIMRNETDCDSESEIETTCIGYAPLLAPTVMEEENLIQGDAYALQFDLYPNPATTAINIRLLQAVEEGGHATLFNAMGQVVEVQEIYSGQESLSFDMSAQRAAEYIVRVTTERGTKMKKVMVLR